MGDHGRRSETVRVSAAASHPGDAAVLPAGPGPLAGDPFLGDFSGYNVVVGDWRPNSNLYGRAPAAIFGLGGDDRIDGTGVSDWLEGGAGNDFIVGGNGDDIIWGGEGADFVRAGNGADRLIFVAGDVGGPDTNVPTSRSPDVIEDFDPTRDRLEFYGFSEPPVVEQIGAGASAYVLLTFANGDQIRLNYMTAARIAANPDCIRMMDGPGPTARQEEDGRPVEMTADINLAEGEIRTFNQGLGYDTRTFTLTNNGTIVVEMEPGVGAGDTLAATGVNGHLVNGQSGIIRAINHGSVGAIGLSSAFDGASNAGLIEAIAVTDATGVYSRSTYWAFDNSGIVRAVGGELAMGVYLSNIPVVTTAPQRAQARVENSGQILAEGETAIGIRSDMNMTLTNSGLVQATGELLAIGYISDFNGSFTNTGTIRAVTGPGGAASIGITAYNLQEPIARGGGFQTYVNHGLIEADIAILIQDSGGFFMESSVERVLNTGTIRGHIILGLGHDEVRNQGKITGDIDLGADADLFDGAGGQLTGAVFGGEGDDRLIGGDLGDILFGDEGADSIFGGAGDDVIDGGRGHDALDGGAGMDVLSFLSSGRGVTVNLGAGTATANGVDTIAGFEGVWGSRFADRIIGSSAANTLEGNSGDDEIAGGGGDDWLYGDRGADKLTGGAGADTFLFSIGDGADVITDFKTGLDRLVIHGYGAAAATLQQVGADTRVLLAGGDSLLLRNVQASTLSGSLTFDPTPLAPAPSLGVASTLVLNELLVLQDGERLEIGRVLDLQIGPNDLPAAGLVLQNRDGGPQPSIISSGHIVIEGGGAYGSVAGLALASSDALGTAGFVNRLTGRFDLTTDGATDAIGAHALVTFRNDGVFNVTAGGDALGAEPQREFVNTGTMTIRGGESAVGARMLIGFGDLWNDGVIDVRGQTASIGVDLLQSNSHGAPAHAFVNRGQIRVADATAEADSVGVSYAVRWEGWFVNTGLIEADYALRMAPGHSALSQGYVINTGELRGRVDLGSDAVTLFNDGLITGRVDMGDANDIYDGRAGRQSGGVFGDAGDDILMAGAGANRLEGGDGSDVLSGGGGMDTLVGGAGADRFHVGAGADVIEDFSAAAGDRIHVGGYAGWQSVVQQGADVLVTFGGANSVLLRNMQAAAVTTGLFVFNAAAPATPTGRIPGAATPDSPVIAGSPPVAPMVREGGAAADVFTGGALDDTLFGRGGGDDLSGGAGDDLLDGGGDGDHLDGGDGDDLLFGGDGDDVLVGGRGFDELRGGAGADVFELGVDGVQMDRIVDFNLAEGDRIVVRDVTGVTENSIYFIFQSWSESGVEETYLFVNASDIAEFGANVTIYGTAQDDVLYPMVGTDAVLYGLDGNDSLNCDTERDALFFGGTGDDRLTGGGGDDQLYGGAGDDIMTGRGGADLLDGGDGYDVYETMQAREFYWLLVDGDGFVLKGEDGSDRLINVELIRFHDGTVIDLAKQYGPDGWGAWVKGGEDGPQVLPSSPDGASGPEPKVLDDGAWVLPPPDADLPPVMPPLTDDFAGFKHLPSGDSPEIMPGVDARDLPLLLPPEGVSFKHMDSLLWRDDGLRERPIHWDDLLA